MFAALDTLMAAALPQMELYCEIGRLVNARPEKGAAVAAAEYLGKAYPDAKGFSPRNLRRMRGFCLAYEDAPEMMAEAMAIGWTRNVTILEGCESLEERAWYIRAVRRFGWTKAELVEQIHAKAHLGVPLDFADAACYTEENATTKEAPRHASAQDTQRYGTGNARSGDQLSPLLCLLYHRLLYQGIHADPLLVRQRRGRPMGVADGVGPPGCRCLRQVLCQDGETGQSGIASEPCQLPTGGIRLPLRGQTCELSIRRSLTCKFGPISRFTVSSMPVINTAKPTAGELPATL